jgi:hypothetical protein
VELEDQANGELYLVTCDKVWSEIIVEWLNVSGLYVADRRRTC